MIVFMSVNELGVKSQQCQHVSAKALGEQRVAVVRGMHRSNFHREQKACN
jgi:hypothetical protein